MKIETKSLGTLMDILKSNFDSKHYIKMEVIRRKLKQDSEETVQLIEVKISAPIGTGTEHWTFEYAYELLKKPKEMDLCIKRWSEAFAIAKWKPTLNLEGYTSVNNNTIN